MIAKDARGLGPRTYTGPDGACLHSLIRRLPAWRSAAAAICLVAAIFSSSCSRGAAADDEERSADRTLAVALRAHSAGRIEEAADLYERVLVLDPRNKFAYYNLGLIDQTRGRDDEAVDAYRQSLAIDPSFVPALFNLAILRTEQGAVDEAISLYRSVIEENADHAAAHLNLGFLLLDEGHRGQGEAELELATRLDPSLASRIPVETLGVVDVTDG
jgi:tetratricopeptide (TPR) repeat protein